MFSPVADDGQAPRVAGRIAGAVERRVRPRADLRRGEGPGPRPRRVHGVDDISGGVVHGEPDKNGAYPADGRVAPCDLIATVLDRLGSRRRPSSGTRRTARSRPAAGASSRPSCEHVASHRKNPELPPRFAFSAPDPFAQPARRVTRRWTRPAGSATRRSREITAAAGSAPRRAGAELQHLARGFRVGRPPRSPGRRVRQRPAP